jgi:hypothetical protein
MLVIVDARDSVFDVTQNPRDDDSLDAKLSEPARRGASQIVETPRRGETGAPPDAVDPILAKGQRPAVAARKDVLACSGGAERLQQGDRRFEISVR